MFCLKVIGVARRRLVLFVDAFLQLLSLVLFQDYFLEVLKLNLLKDVVDLKCAYNLFLALHAVQLFTEFVLVRLGLADGQLHLLQLCRERTLLVSEGDNFKVNLGHVRLQRSNVAPHVVHLFLKVTLGRRFSRVA